MKVILKRDVPKIGRAHDVVDVNEGYANNFLFPNKLAIKGTPELIENANKKKIEKADKKKMQHSLLEKTILEFKGREFVIKKPVNDKGTLFSKIHEKDICTLLEKEIGIKLDEKNIILEKIIDRIGEYEIKILSDGIKSSFNLKINQQ